ncbi:MAG: hypothetical protein ABSG40_17705 [Terriglobales bacterium]
MLLIVLAFLASPLSGAETVKFSWVKIRRHKNERSRLLVDKDGDLKFDDAGRKLTFRSEAGDDVDIGYDDITKVIFERTSRMRGGPIAYLSVPGMIAAGQHVTDYWFYLEYESGDHNEPVLFDIPKSSSEKVIAKARDLFGSRVAMPEFDEKGEEIDPNTLPDLKSKHTFTADRKSHPLPEVKAEKATVVVVCPALENWGAGRGNQFKLHANDRVIAVNRAGTYSIAYLDPGKYKLVSQSVNANGFEMRLEAGKEYYFLQNTFQGAFKWDTGLSRNSPELVMYELNGAYYSDWKRK